jgi:hypothetical protein
MLATDKHSSLYSTERQRRRSKSLITSRPAGRRPPRRRRRRQHHQEDPPSEQPVRQPDEDHHQDDDAGSVDAGVAPPPRPPEASPERAGVAVERVANPRDQQRRPGAVLPAGRRRSQQLRRQPRWTGQRPGALLRDHPGVNPRKTCFSPSLTRRPNKFEHSSLASF